MVQCEAASSSEITGRVGDCCTSLFISPLLFSKKHVSVGDQNLGHAFLHKFIMKTVLLHQMVPSGVCKLADVTAPLLVVF